MIWQKYDKDNTVYHVGGDASKDWRLKYDAPPLQQKAKINLR